MAGFTACILLPPGDIDKRRQEIRDTLMKAASSADGDNLWIAERPFLVTFGGDYPGELAEMTENGLAAVLGWQPVDLCGVAAMCNAPEDHRILAMQCALIASGFGGMIDFGGTLHGWDTPRQERPLATELSAPHGRLIAVHYMTVDGLCATSHVGDAEFLRHWLDHPLFRMIK